MSPWSFIHVTDIHVGSPRSFRFAPAFNENWKTACRQIRALCPDLILIGGDLTRDGNVHDFEFAQVKHMLEGLGVPYRAIPGNMDTGNKHTRRNRCGKLQDDSSLNVTGEPLDRFIRHFGPMPWSIVHKNVRFSGFYEAVAGSGLPHEQQMWEWLENLRHLPVAQHHVMLMHYALFVDRIDEPTFDITDPTQYLNWYFGVDQSHRERMYQAFKAARVNVVLSGHIHCRRPMQVVEGMRFYKGASTAFPQWGDRWPDGDETLGFYHFQVRGPDLDAAFIPLEVVSTAKGYGPGGHPPPEQRDYSLAWER